MGIEIDFDHKLVPEWRYKYVNYNEGKRHIKAISRAAHLLNSTTRPTIRVSNFNKPDKKSSVGGKASSGHGLMSNFLTFDFHDRKQTSKNSNARNESTLVKNSGETHSNPNSTNIPLSLTSLPSAKDEKNANYNPGNTLSPGDNFSSSKETFISQEKKPAIDNFSRDFPSKISGLELSRETRKDTLRESRIDAQREAHRESLVPTVRKVGTASTIRSGYASPLINENNKFYKMQQRSPISSKSFLSNVFSNEPPMSTIDSYQTNNGVTALEIVRLRQNDFVKWFEQEIENVDLFYKSKEDEVAVLLNKLREQLLEMRSRRLKELTEAQHYYKPQASSPDGIIDTRKYFNNRETTRLSSGDWLRNTFRPAWNFAVDVRNRLSNSFVGENTRALKNMQETLSSRTSITVINNPNPNMMEKEDDHAQRSQYADQVPYRKAKRKLKLALFECFRGIKLLKSYTVLNQLAFRKLVRKYNQAAGTHAPIINLSGKVSQAWFVKSDVLDSQLSSAVSLYARYFECGNQTIALVKLRGSIAPRTDESAISFRNGAFIGIGTVFCILGLIKGNQLLNSPDPIVRTKTLSLIELYAGFFLCLYLFALFCFDCFIWTQNHINYQFIFEFDIGHTLDWRKLPSVPSFLLTFLGLCMWINFNISESSELFIYIPVILIAATVFLMFLPAPILFHRGRRWFLYSNWRLLLAGLYPVEFRDFFLGDMYCSLTYVMANIELFFCLYLDHWENPQKCGSSKSRLLGFFTAIPAIWRILQCLRRYYDTRDMFPHLLNCAKYVTTVLYLTCLSMYRISGTRTDVILFIIAAFVNSSFSSVWDVLMDWSLLQPSAKDYFLRDVRGYRNSWWYYGAMILNPIMRFFWILYTANLPVLGHSSKISFFIAFAEVTRRGIWAIFRVENAHCSNVAHSKASHDLQLPYTTLIKPENPAIEPGASANISHSNRSATQTSLETRHSIESISNRRPFARLISDAHTKDFEKRRQKGGGGSLPRGPGNKSIELDSEEETSSENDGEIEKNIQKLSWKSSQ